MDATHHGRLQTTGQPIGPWEAPGVITVKPTILHESGFVSEPS